MADKINLALVFGGKSVEHDVSVISARNIFQHADHGRFNVVPIGIDKKGKWHLMPEVDKNFDRGEEIRILMDPTESSIEGRRMGKKILVDVAFVILHGTDGEDGSIQGFFKVLGIPVVGSGVLGSSVSMNKVLAKRLLVAADIPTARYTIVEEGYPLPLYTDIANKLGEIVIIKPASLGSSVGVSKASNEEEFEMAIAEALKYDNSLVIEEFILGRELECAILGNHMAIASPPGEIKLKKDYELYSFDAKYVDGDAVDIAVPAEIDAEIAEEIKTLCLKAYKALACEDLARVDLFLSSNNQIFINEINTLPGFTNISMYPKLCALMGIGYTELISELVDYCLERDAKSKKLQTEYISGLS